jgi:hypothetical protein
LFTTIGDCDRFMLAPDPCGEIMSAECYAYWKEKAEECLRIAGASTDPGMVVALTALAAIYLAAIGEPVESQLGEAAE